jgi:hypothetical protein
MDYLTSIDIFNRNNLIGDQSITTINNFDDYLNILLSPFNDVLTTLLLEADNIQVALITTYIRGAITALQIKDEVIQTKYNLSANVASITSDSNDYIAQLNITKTAFTTLLNTKALPTTPLTRPTLTTVLESSNISAINKQYATSKVIDYILPTPIPNTKLYINKEGTDYIWAV